MPVRAGRETKICREGVEGQWTEWGIKRYSMIFSHPDSQTDYAFKFNPLYTLVRTEHWQRTDVGSL